MVKEQIFARDMGSIIRAYVDSEGNVDYLALGMRDDVVNFVESLRTFDMSVLKTKNEKLSFWINVYNMLAIYGVMRELKKNPGFAKKGYNGLINKIKFFYLNKYEVSGKKYNLMDIENILRKKCKEPRIHFALVCGAGSCPILKDGLYSSTDIDKELDVAAELFINSTNGTILDKENKTIYLSWIFKRYGRDFGDDKDSVVRFIARYHYEKDYIENNMDELKVKYMDYDWGLNISQ